MAAARVTSALRNRRPEAGLKSPAAPARRSDNHRNLFAL